MHLNEKEMKVLDEGDVIELKEGTVIAWVPKHFLYSNKSGVFDEYDKGAIILVDMKYLQCIKQRMTVVAQRGMGFHIETAIMCFVKRLVRKQADLIDELNFTKVVLLMQ